MDTITDRVIKQRAPTFYKARYQKQIIISWGLATLLGVLGFITGQLIRGNNALQIENQQLRTGFDPVKPIIAIKGDK